MNARDQVERRDHSWYDHFDEETGAILLGVSCDNGQHVVALERRRVESGRKWSPIVRGKDAGGVRDFLDGRAIHCGTGLKLQATEELCDDYGSWTKYLNTGVVVRYETVWAKEGPIVMLHTAVGGHVFKTRLELGMRFRWTEDAR